MSALRRIRLVTPGPGFLGSCDSGQAPVSANTGGAGASDQDVASVAPDILQSHTDIRKVRLKHGDKQLLSVTEHHRRVEHSSEELTLSNR